MARMHSRRRGSSGSTTARNPDHGWVRYDAEEVKDLVEKLANQGKHASDIGRVLRDRYGVPDVQEITGETVTEILEERDLQPEVPEDLYSLMEKAVSIAEHLDENENDTTAKRNLSLTEAKIRRLADYYQGEKIPEDWSYSLDRARLLVE